MVHLIEAPKVEGQELALEQLAVAVRLIVKKEGGRQVQVCQPFLIVHEFVFLVSFDLFSVIQKRCFQGR